MVERRSVSSAVRRRKTSVVVNVVNIMGNDQEGGRRWAFIVNIRSQW
jgi:hypothetical protein